MDSGQSEVAKQNLKSADDGENKKTDVCKKGSEGFQTNEVVKPILQSVVATNHWFSSMLDFQH